MIEAKNLHKIYNSGIKALHVLKGIDLKIEKGSIVAIVGPSGAGKSTLLHLLGGLDYPTEGKIFFDKLDLYNLSDLEISKIRNKRIGFVFQFYHLLAEFSVIENVSLPAMLNPVRRSFRKRRKVLGGSVSNGVNGSSKIQVRNKAREILNSMGLSERIEHYPNQLSGGEQQRVAIARALINDPELLLCDEPTGNLDSQTGAEVIALLKELNKSRSTTIVLVTHNQELAAVADTVYHLRDGVLIK